MLTPTKQPTLQGRDRDVIPGDLRDYKRTLSMRIKSYNVLSEALEKTPKENWPGFLKPLAPLPFNVFRLMSKIEAEEIQGTYLLEIAIEAGDPKGLGTILNAVMQTLFNKLEEEQELQYARQLGYLTEERDRIMKKIELQRDGLIQLATNANQKAFLHKAYDVHLEKVRLLQDTYWQIETDRIEKQRDLETIIEKNEALSKLDLAPVANQRVADNFGINRMEQSTYENLQELRSSIDGLTPQNRERQYVEKRMSAMEIYLKEYKDNVKKNTRNMLINQRELEMEKTKLAAEAALKAANKAATHLAQKKQEAENEASNVSEIIFNAQGIIFDIDQLQTRLAALDSRIDDNQLQAKTPLPMHIDREAQNPEQAFDTNKKKLLIMAFMLSFGFVGATCLLFDILDNRIRSRSEIEKLFGGEIPASIPLVMEANEDKIDQVLRNNQFPLIAHAYRQLAVRLYPEKTKEGAKIFCLTGTEEEVGVSSLAVNLSECLAGYGDKVLLIELNIHRPAALWDSIHPDASLSNAIEKKTLIQQAIKQDKSRGIDILPSGYSVPTTLPPLSHIAKLLDDLRSKYDWILLDCAPLIKDDLAQLAAQKSDAAIVSIWEDKTSYTHLYKTKTMLERYEIPAMTGVLTETINPESWILTTIQSALNLLTLFHQKTKATISMLKTKIFNTKTP